MPISDPRTPLYGSPGNPPDETRFQPASAGFDPDPTHQPGRLGREVPEARRNRCGRPLPPCGASARFRGKRGGARQVGAGVPRQPARRRHRRGPHHERSRHRHPGHPDQLFCAARGRLHPGRGRRRFPRHLRSPARSGRNHAPWRRCGLRLLPHPPQGRRGQGHALHGVGPLQLHQRVRPVLLHGGERRRAPWRPDGRAAHRPPRCDGVHHRQAHARPLEQFQRVGGRERRLHGGRGPRPALGAGAQSQAQRQADRKGRLPARRRPVGLPDAWPCASCGTPS